MATNNNNGNANKTAEKTWTTTQDVFSPREERNRNGKLVSDEMGKNERRIETERAFFARSSKISRSPPVRRDSWPLLPRKTSTEQKKNAPADKSEAVPLQSNLGDGNQRSTGILPPVTPPREESNALAEGSSIFMKSPRRAHIVKMRQEEEEVLRSCEEIVASMRAATKIQKNISATVKDGIEKLSEALSVIKTCRDSWKRTEKEINAEGQRKPADPQRAVPSTTTKRPAEKQEEKKEKEDDPSENFTQVLGKKAKRRLQAKERQQSQKQQEHQAQKKTATAGAPKEAKRRPKPRPSAIVIKPSETKTYSDVLAEI